MVHDLVSWRDFKTTHLPTCLYRARLYLPGPMLHGRAPAPGTAHHPRPHGSLCSSALPLRPSSRNAHALPLRPSSQFELACIAVIMLNMVCMFLNHWDQSSTWVLMSDLACQVVCGCRIDGLGAQRWLDPAS